MTLLILSGTREGREISQQLHAKNRPVIASLAGATRSPRAQDVPTRVGGFGGADGFETFLKDNAIHAVIDATHPFANAITRRSADICARLNIPFCLFERPAWTPEELDNWTLIPDETEAARFIPNGSTVFLATGRQTLERFENLSTCRLICRQIDPPTGPFPFENGEFLIGRPPFSVEHEIALFKKLGVDWLIVKNAGGKASFSKLEAARALGLPVAMIERPKQPDVFKVAEIDAVVEWALANG